jgi:putative ABC transport system ATP-binding protein
MDKNHSILELKNVSKIYQMGGEELYALRDINLNINQGEFVAIVGSSGSGKSTLMNMIGVLDRPTNGEVYLKNKKVKNLDKDTLSNFRGQQVGFIFQQYNLIPRLTAAQNVALTLEFLDFEEKKIEEYVSIALKLVGLKDKKDHTPGKLSGGQQQRVSIARSLVANPSIILADEPTGALDSKTGRDVMDILVNLNKSGKTIIMITHDLNLAKYAKRIIEIKDGEIIKDYNNKHQLEIK